MRTRHFCHGGLYFTHCGIENATRAKYGGKTGAPRRFATTSPHHFYTPSFKRKRLRIRVALATAELCRPVALSFFIYFFLYIIYIILKEKYIKRKAAKQLYRSGVFHVKHNTEQNHNTAKCSKISEKFRNRKGENRNVPRETTEVVGSCFSRENTSQRQDKGGKLK